MLSNVARGAYYKARTRKWLKALGYDVAELEVVRWVFAAGRRVPVKRDQFASDLLAMSHRRLIFVQVKSGAQCAGVRSFPDARAAFGEFRFPPFTERWIVAWEFRARRPRVLNVLEGSEFDGQEAARTKKGKGRR